MMGADNLRSFHRWQKWRGIADLIPIAVIDRLGPSLYSLGSTAGQALARARIPESAAASLADRRPPAWVFLHGLKSPLSSTALRAQRGRGQGDGAGEESGESHKSAAESDEKGVVAPTVIANPAGELRRARAESRPEHEHG
jgi:nicotinate-nucleotide adenylyltransferase